ncbi:MAG: septum formation protein Maf [Sporocytophaga sp.]|uniref:Maf family nucleotide pyrophosphatase n=1 Tax=Sporocytophaga sp. TaxID=2231183 RepID=UPI001AFEB4A4|nr:Maf family nucleotide pyrophosphatase [Sporocytophaga sp.]MBO9702456.1 septum formation protein Maf [Sporocytophaga sp.]
MNKNLNIILASNSPRRQQILKEAGIIFLVRSKNIPEDYPSDLPKRSISEYLAEKKAESFCDESQNSLIIAADTTVLVDGNILEKPVNQFDATRMLRELSGKYHEVITGVCLLHKNKKISFSDTTKVYFKELSEAEIRHYVETYKPFDKAGSYGIQEWIGLIGITGIEGSYFNVMGLPIHKVYESLKEFK